MIKDAIGFAIGMAMVINVVFGSLYFWIKVL